MERTKVTKTTHTSSNKRLPSLKLFTVLKTGEVGQLPCSEGRMSRMVSQLGSKPAFGSGDEKPDERRDFGGLFLK